MPRYFFDFDDGQMQPDDLGTELNNETEARNEAVRLFGGLMGDDAECFKREWKVSVRGERLTLFSLTLTIDERNR